MGSWLGEPPIWWQPNKCLIRSYHSLSAEHALKRFPLLIVGDSTNQGIHSEICDGILTDYEFGKSRCGGGHLLFKRVNTVAEALENGKFIDIMSKLQPLEGKSKTLLINFGAHENKASRSACPNPHISQSLDKVHLSGKRTTTIWKDTGMYDITRNTSMNRPLSSDCGLGDVVINDFVGLVTQFVSRLRDSGFNGNIIWRTNQINFGIDFMGSSNAFKLKVNQKITLNTALIRDLGVNILDVERLTGERPETFVHLGTNHFYCQCNTGCSCANKTECDEYDKDCSLHARPRCRSQECEVLRFDYFSNGAPNRVVAQLVLNALDMRFWQILDNKLNTSGNCALVMGNHSLQDPGKGQEIDSFDHIIRVGTDAVPLASNPQTGTRTDIFLLPAHLYNPTSVNSLKSLLNNTLFLVVHVDVRDATEPLARYGKNQWMYGSTLPYMNMILDNFGKGRKTIVTLLDSLHVQDENQRPQKLCKSTRVFKK